MMICALCHKRRPAQGMMTSDYSGAHFCPDVEDCRKRAKRNGHVPVKTMREWREQVKATLQAASSEAEEGDTVPKERTKNQQKTIDKMVEWRKAGDGIATIANKLNKAKTPTFGSGKQWYAITVRSVLIQAMGLEAYNATRKRTPTAAAA